MKQLLQPLPSIKQKQSSLKTPDELDFSIFRSPLLPYVPTTPVHEDVGTRLSNETRGKCRELFSQACLNAMCPHVELAIAKVIAVGKPITAQVLIQCASLIHGHIYGSRHISEFFYSDMMDKVKEPSIFMNILGDVNHPSKHVMYYRKSTMTPVPTQV
jgi:hypothetical protein